MCGVLLLNRRICFASHSGEVAVSQENVGGVYFNSVSFVLLDSSIKTEPFGYFKIIKITNINSPLD